MENSNGIKVGKYTLEEDVDCKVTYDGTEIFKKAVDKHNIDPSDFEYAEWVGLGGILVIEE